MIAKLIFSKTTETRDGPRWENRNANETKTLHQIGVHQITPNIYIYISKKNKYKTYAQGYLLHSNEDDHGN